MSIKQKIIYGVALLAVAVSPLFVAAPTYADCGSVHTAILDCPDLDKNATPGEGAIWSFLLMAIKIMTGGVGVLAVAGIVYGSVLYASAGGSPEQVKKAKTIFLNVAIGVIAFGAMYFLLNFIIPGGVFA